MISFVGIYHNHKLQSENTLREDLKSYFDEEKLIQSSNQILLKGRTHGPIRYAMAIYDDGIKYTFEVNEDTLLLISTDSDVNSDLVISRVLDYLKH